MDVGSQEAVVALAQRILDLDRTRPVIALTSRPRDNHPALDPAAIRAIVGTQADVFFLRTGRLTFVLKERLPEGMDVYGGAARLWWPGVSGESSLFDHPLIHESAAVYGSQALRTFESAWKRGRPSTRVGADVDPVAELRDRERDEARTEIERLRRENAELEQRVSHERSLRRAAQRREREARRHSDEPVRVTEAEDELEPELAFHQDVLEAWYEHLTPSDRREHPLGPYLLGGRFLDSADQLQTVPRHRLAWVCAMVAAGRAPEVSSLELHPLRTGRGGNDPQRVRARDGATAWRCALKTSSPSAPRLHYWSLPSGAIEFAKVGPHDDMESSE